MGSFKILNEHGPPMLRSLNWITMKKPEKRSAREKKKMFFLRFFLFFFFSISIIIIVCHNVEIGEICAREFDGRKRGKKQKKLTTRTSDGTISINRTYRRLWWKRNRGYTGLSMVVVQSK